MFIEKSKSSQGRETTMLKSKLKNFATTNMFWSTEAITRTCSVKEVFLEVLQN